MSDERDKNKADQLQKHYNTSEKEGKMLKIRLPGYVMLQFIVLRRKQMFKAGF